MITTKPTEVEFYCPKCGKKLKGLPHKKNWSLRFTCTNKKCNYSGTEFIVHNPLKDIDSEPGDSWSITWLK